MASVNLSDNLKMDIMLTSADNYVVWVATIRCNLRTVKLWGYVDKSIQPMNNSPDKLVVPIAANAAPMCPLLSLPSRPDTENQNVAVITFMLIRANI